MSQKRQEAPNVDNDTMYYLLLLMTVADLTGHIPHVRIQLMTE